MAVKIHIAQEGQSIYDLAILLYKDTRGVGELTRLNPKVFLDLDAQDYQGQDILFEDDKTFPVFVAPENVEIKGIPNYLSRGGQSVYDVAIQLYGELGDGLARVIGFYNDLDAVPDVNIDIERTKAINPVGTFFKNSGTLVATIGDMISDDGDGIFDDSFDDSFE